jgi:hypothetical protein
VPGEGQGLVPISQHRRDQLTSPDLGMDSDSPLLSYCHLRQKGDDVMERITEMGGG